ncbi:MAG: hypothetical protein U0869_14070 [Chloroflexota bacterium]
MRSAAPVTSRPGLWRAVVAVVGVIVVAWRAALFGSLPDCGTGSAFLAPIGWMVDLGTVTFLVTAAVSIALLLLGAGRRTLLGFAGAATLAAVAATVASEWADGCGRYRDGTYAAGAILAAGTASLVGAAVGLLVLRALLRRRGAEGRPVTAPRTRIVGHYTVRSGPAARAGTPVWAVVSPTDLTLIGIGGRVVGRVPRAGVEVEVVGDRVIVLVGDVPWAVLVPDADTEALALGAELTPGRPRSSAGAAG